MPQRKTVARSKPVLVAGKPGQDPTLPSTAIILGGQLRHLCFDFNAICIADKLTGRNLLREAVGEELDAAAIRGLLYAALLRSEPEITLEQVGSWLQFSNLRAVQAAITASWLESIEQAEPGEAKGQAQPKV